MYIMLYVLYFLYRTVYTICTLYVPCCRLNVPHSPAITATDLLMKISLNLTCIEADEIFYIQDNPENSKSFGGNTNFGVVALD